MWHSMVLIINDRIVVRFGMFLGDQTNNEAEYQGALFVLRHILYLQPRRVYVYLDSLLVTSQMTGVWACNAINLIEYYERALQFMSRIRRIERIEQFTVKHIYREFNVNADATANETIDRYRQEIHSNGMVIQENWNRTLLSDAQRASINADVLPNV